MTVTETIYGRDRAQQLEDIMRKMRLPTHPALAALEYEEERTDLHGVGGSRHGWDAQNEPIVQYTCACRFTTAEHATAFDATCELISHALHTCAKCHGPKPADSFPRCSDCAF